MTHMQSMKDSDGVFGEFDHAYEEPCLKCGSDQVRYRIWESSCGGYEDYHHKCFACGHTWWVDGIDS